MISESLMSGSKVQLRIPSSPVFPAEVRVVTVMECLPTIQETRVNAKGSFGTSTTKSFITKKPNRDFCNKLEICKTGEA